MSGAFSPAPAPTAAPARPVGLLNVPISLPDRMKNGKLEPLTHLSPSSVVRFHRCPDQWRRHYLLGERSPASGAIHLGSCVDDTLMFHYQMLLDGKLDPDLIARPDELITNGHLTLLSDVFDDTWRRLLDDRAVVFEDDMPAERLHAQGADLLGLFLTQLAPTIGMPTAIQREAHFRMADHLEWTIYGKPDIETDDAVHDVKVKGGFINQGDADRSLQAGTYLTERWRNRGQTGLPFVFDVLRKQTRRSNKLDAKATTTTRSVSQMRGVLATYATTARAIDALYRTYGRDELWSFASEEHPWACKLCDFADSCARNGL
jgi:hypothetical protein